jgi:hypothetical protein
VSTLYRVTMLVVTLTAVASGILFGAWVHAALS